jgi:hypothetical protein
MKRTPFVISILAIVLVFSLVHSSCRKKKGEPKSIICTDKMVYAKTDTVKLTNCSENFTKQRWLLPDGTQSTAAAVYFVPPTVGSYKFSLYVSNDDFIYDYESFKYIEVK